MELENVLNEIEKLNIEEQRSLLDIVQKRLIEVERLEIKEEYDKIKKLKKNDKLKAYSVNEFFDKIESSIYKN